jgi:DNA/RNA-binding domain of Phe-tRNA-synthetase-like protein
MQFSHHAAIWQQHPELVPGVLHASGIRPDAEVEGLILSLFESARPRLAHEGAEGAWPEVQAWRRAFSRMNLKPTQYRCASESLLRRFRKEGELPRIHPLVDVCNAASLAYGVPVAVFDLAGVSGALQVRHADGSETYLSLAGEAEVPEPGEVIFVDGSHHAHARRWSHRQSGRSAVRPSTSQVLVVAEGMHATAREDIARLMEQLASSLRSLGSVEPETHVLHPAEPVFRLSHSKTNTA